MDDYEIFVVYFIFTVGILAAFGCFILEYHSNIDEALMYCRDQGFAEVVAFHPKFSFQQGPFVVSCTGVSRTFVVRGDS